MSPDRTEQVRSGLPRIPGGDPWPPGGTVAGSPSAVEFASESAVVTVSCAPAEQIPGALAEAGAPATASPARAELRRGLPRVSGGDPWPPSGRAAAQSADASAVVTSDAVLRRGLPRVAGGEAWPPEGRAPAGAPDASTATTVSAATVSVPAESGTTAAARKSAPISAELTVEAPATVLAEAADEASTAVVSERAAPEPVAPEAAPTTAPAPAKPSARARKPRMIGSRPLAQWVKFAVWGLVGAVVVAGIIVLAARGVTTLPGVPEFMTRFPGEYHPPIAADEGFPAWARWTHFLNFFFMVLIVRTGLLVRYQQKPPAFYTPKRGGKKISLYLWLHTSIDILWLLNGAVFVVLLFVTDHWVRIVPTSWEVFPNALSAGLQYLTLEWPTENGWVSYNSLQQLMYFTVVFIAAPLAAVTGVRMSEWWPERARRLNRLYPAPLARAIHFPVMLFFVLFVIVHVFLVLATGALRNLNHMFAGTDQVNWAGFWWFVVALLAATAVGWLARPLVIAPIANLFGRVSNR